MLRTFAVIGFVAAAAMGYHLVSGERSTPAKNVRSAAIENAERVKRGPYITHRKEISESEAVRVLVIPHPWGEFFDTMCVIYTHKDFKAATMQCPNADPGSLKDEFQPAP
jgi:hypothetical protein